MGAITTNPRMVLPFGDLLFYNFNSIRHPKVIVF